MSGFLNQSESPADAEMNIINMQNTCLAWLMLDNVSVWKVMQNTAGNKTEPGVFQERVGFKGVQKRIQVQLIQFIKMSTFIIFF